MVKNRASHNRTDHNHAKNLAVQYPRADNRAYHDRAIKLVNCKT